MNFFGREKEIGILRRERSLSIENSRFTVLTGRRRVGKTELVDRALNDGNGDYVYLLLTRQTERNLAASLQEEAVRALGGRLKIYGTCEKLKDLLREIIRLAEERPLTLVIDEFQEMDRINPGFYGEFQGLWDELNRKVKLNLVVSGSVNRLMNKIFFSYGEPLYGRNTAHLSLRPFPASLLKEILSAHSRRFSKDDVLSLWTMTGGVARYVSLFMDAHAFNRKKMIDLFFSEASPFLEEGRSILMQEFGNDSATYFTILTSIASGHTKFAEIKNDLGSDVGAYLSNLERNYGLIRKVNPVFAPPASKNAVFRIEDPFLRFWFRYVFRCAPYVERGMFERLRALVSEDFDVFSGRSLERYFEWKFTEEERYTCMGGWWDRKGENEIDLVCEDETAGAIDFYEIKRRKSAIDLAALEAKTSRFFEKHPEKLRLKRRILGLSIDDM